MAIDIEKAFGLILEALAKQSAELTAQAKDIAEIKGKLTGAVTPPNADVPGSVWDNLSATDPLADFEESPQGWINKKFYSQDFPGDRHMLAGCWAGVEVPTGRVLHAGNKADLVARRKAALALHDLDVAGRYDGTTYAVLNISPEVAACLLCLRLVEVVPGVFGVGLIPDSYANITDLQTLFLKLKALSEGTGGPSGQP